MGRKQSKDENARHEHIPRVSPPVRKTAAMATCDKCGARALENAAGTGPIQHYDQRVPNAHNTGTYCK